jgi:ATP-dependent helicase/nuclease subunit B
MTKFLEHTANTLFEKYGDGISTLCIVLPNRRGGLFLRRYIARLAGKTIWSPAVYSIEDLFTELSGMTVCDSTRQIFELYEVHKEIEGAQAKPFEEFINWGQQLLHDFSEVDEYMVGPRELFTYLSEARAMSLWNLDQSPLSQFQSDYLKFYASILTYYDKFNQRLLAANTGYPGLIFRTVAENIGEVSRKAAWERIVFAGFNALTKAEETAIDGLVLAGKAELLWDCDKYYFDDKGQEAGDFLRRWLRKWPVTTSRWVFDNFSSGKKEITVTGVPFNVGQVKYCGEVLGKMLSEGINPEEIAVVLNDEQLLNPLLNSLPKEAGALNITMGLSLKQSPLFSLFDALFRLQEDAQRFKKTKKDGRPLYYFRDVLRVLQHPFVAGMADAQTGGNRFVYEELVDSIRTGNRVFLDMDQRLNKPSNGLFAPNLDFLVTIFEPWGDLLSSLECLKKIIVFLREALLAEKSEAGPDPVRLEFLYAFSRVIHQVEGLMAQYGSIKTLTALHQLFNRLAESTSLPFYGEPLKGVQVMGMLETRVLDFENVILLSVNEDILPSGKTQHSFIPYDIRREFGMPTYLNKNSIYAYHFYRILQRAKRVELVFNTEPDELGGGERSRFIKQIGEELTKFNKDIMIKEQVLSSPPVMGIDYPPIIVEKKGEVLDMLKGSLPRGLSPSSLNSYRRCSLQFYFSYLAGLEEQKELEETVDRQTLGSAVHHALAKLFENIKGKPAGKAELTALLEQVGEKVEKAFAKEAEGADMAWGQNLLLLNVAKFMVRNLIREEIRRLEDNSNGRTTLTVRSLEDFIDRKVAVYVNDEMLDVRVKGFIDRVDENGNIWKIIDYKTGRVNKNDLAVEEWEELRTDPAKDMAFQLLTYAWMLSGRINAKELAFEPSIVSLRAVSDDTLKIRVPGQEGGVTKEHLKEFGNILSSILEEIFDVTKPFVQTDDLDICSRCAFISLCGR